MCITPWFTALSLEMGLGGKKMNSVDDKLSIVGFAPQLSMASAIFFFSFENFLVITPTNSPNNMLSIQHFFYFFISKVSVRLFWSSEKIPIFLWQTF